MPIVRVEDEAEFEVPEGTRLVLALEDNGIDVLHRCGGFARCTTCQVEVLGSNPPPITESELLALEGSDAGPAIRLSCQVLVLEDINVRVVNRSHIVGLRPGPRPQAVLTTRRPDPPAA